MWVLLTLLALPLTAQYRHYDFIGAGHTYEVQVTTSSNAPNTEGKNTVDGFPIQNDEQYGDLEEFEGNGFHTVHNFNTAWSTNNLVAPDLLRQRIGFALSQLMVINNQTDFFYDVGVASSNYYDLLLNNAFGNYEKLLMEVTRSASMGTFLSHLNNPKADPVNNIHPDENYAREIMQLFSIGLWELNPDGTRKWQRRWGVW